MKKVVAMLVFLLFLPSISIAAASEMALSLEYDNVFDRDMNFAGGQQALSVGSATSTGSYPSSGAYVKGFSMKSSGVFLKGAMDIHPKLDIFAKAGTAKAKTKHTHVSSSGLNEQIEFSGDSGFAYGAGFNLWIIQVGGIVLTGEGEYSTYKNNGRVAVNGKDLARYTIDGFRDLGFSNATASYTSSTEVKQWYIALKTQESLGKLKPYASLRYSAVAASVDDNVTGTLPASYSWQTNVRTKSEGLGLAVGADAKLSKDMFLGVEGRFWDEQAVKVSFKYQF